MSMTRPPVSTSHVTVRKPRILLVDDEPGVLRGLARVLKSGQPLWDIGLAKDGEEALEMMKAQPFHVVMTDLHMPVMNGLTLLDHLTKRFPETVRLVHSSRIDTMGQQFLKHLAHDVLLKPATASEILRITNWAMEHSVWSAASARGQAGRSA
jgi:two-component system response regulator YesN